MTTATIDPTTRKVPPFGGFNRTILGIELKRMLRNRRTIFFTLVFPAGLFFSFGGTRAGTTTPATATSRRTSWSRWRCTAPRSPPPRPARWSPWSGPWAGPASSG